MRTFDGIMDSLMALAKAENATIEDSFDVVAEWVDDIVYEPYDKVLGWRHNEDFVPILGAVMEGIVLGGYHRSATEYAATELEKYCEGDEENIDYSRTYLVFLLDFMLCERLGEK